MRKPRVIISVNPCPFCGGCVWTPWKSVYGIKEANICGIDYDLPCIDCNDAVGGLHYAMNDTDYHDECVGCGAVLS
jgi:hypothetical protein